MESDNVPQQPPQRLTVLPNPDQLIQMVRQCDLGMFREGLANLYRDAPVTYRLFANFLRAVAADTAAHKEKHGK